MSLINHSSPEFLASLDLKDGYAAENIEQPEKILSALGYPGYSRRFARDVLYVMEHERLDIASAIHGRCDLVPARCNCESQACNHSPGDCQGTADGKGGVRMIHLGAICYTCFATMLHDGADEDWFVLG